MGPGPWGVLQPTLGRLSPGVHAYNAQRRGSRPSPCCIRRAGTPLHQAALTYRPPGPPPLAEHYTRPKLRLFTRLPSYRMVRGAAAERRAAGRRGSLWRPHSAAAAAAVAVRARGRDLVDGIVAVAAVARAQRVRVRPRFALTLRTLLTHGLRSWGGGERASTSAR